MCEKHSVLVSRVLARGEQRAVFAGVISRIDTSMHNIENTKSESTLPCDAAVKIGNCTAIYREVAMYSYLQRCIDAGISPLLRTPAIIATGNVVKTNTNHAIVINAVNSRREERAQTHSRRALAMALLGPSLDVLFDQVRSTEKAGAAEGATESLAVSHTRTGRFWRRADFYWIAAKMLHQLQQLHAAGVIHRDVKPDNFAIRMTKNNVPELFVFDFELAVQYLDAQGKHCSRETLQTVAAVPLVGTTRYASARAHRTRPLARRDDIESFIYTMAYLHSGELPWESCTCDNESIAIAKERADQTALVGMDYLWTRLFGAVRSLRFNATIDYQYWIDCFRMAAGINEVTITI